MSGRVGETTRKGQVHAYNKLKEQKVKVIGVRVKEVGIGL